MSCAAYFDSFHDRFQASGGSSRKKGVDAAENNKTLVNGIAQSSVRSLSECEDEYGSTI